MANAAGNNIVISHKPTENNQLGQTSLSLIIDDILDIVDASPTPRTQYQDLFRYFTDGAV